MTLTDSGILGDHVLSTWQSERRKLHRGCQTFPTEKRLTAVQASWPVQNMATQTGLRGPSIVDGLSLQRMACITEAALIENADSGADIFLGPQNFYGLDDGNIELLFTLRPAGDAWSKTSPALAHERPSLGSLKCTGLSWNATGLVLAAAYGRKDLRGWCDHPGALCTWNIKQQVSDSFNQTSSITLDNCLMCIAFHPLQPDIIAGGTFNGEIYVWDLSKDDPQIAVSGATYVCHSEPITQVAWYHSGKESGICSSSKDTFQIISTSTDGQILLWSADNLNQPLYGYSILYPRSHSSRAQYWGGTCMDVPANTKDHSTIIVGTEGGTVYRCGLQFTQKSINDFSRQVKDSGLLTNSCREGKLKLLSPIKSQHEPHVGPVHCIKFSPFDERVFMTCGYDGFVCIYNDVQAKPILRLEPSEMQILCAGWSPSRPLVIAVGVEGGRIFIFDVQRSMLHPTAAVDASEEGNPIFAMAFNHQKRQYYACSDGVHVKIFQLGSNYTKERILERKQLARFAQSAGGDV
ncbi:WD repeat-containing protein 34 [Marchantia polymorpha subsp. ruderalis]